MMFAERHHDSKSATRFKVDMENINSLRIPCQEIEVLKMKHWNVTIENNAYTFYAIKKEELFNEGINLIKIIIKPKYGYSEIHARTDNKTTYRNILNEGKAHGLEKNSKVPKEKPKSYYFDSSYDTFHDSHKK
jgi:hypothetical protein